MRESLTAASSPKGIRSANFPKKATLIRWLALELDRTSLLIDEGNTLHSGREEIVPLRNDPTFNSCKLFENMLKY